MPAAPKPSPPEPVEPDPTWVHAELWHAVRKALFTLPSRFESDLFISGVLATDLFAFNSSLGATIEEQVINSLNKLRTVWDADQRYALYSFERQPQTFPDVVLRASAPHVEPTVLMGVELKGWYALAKEREPSFRYKVTPGVCAPADLLAVVPWTLSNVISGAPKVFTPYIISARHAAEYRNWYWQYAKGGKGDNSITLSTVATCYPTKRDMIADRPRADAGGNFGRLARTKIMAPYIEELFEEKLAGIPLAAWQAFLSGFADESPRPPPQELEIVAAGLSFAAPSSEIKEQLREKLCEICDLLHLR